MENAVDALKMAAGVLVFVVALSISISTFGQARQSAKMIVDNTDREYDYRYVEALKKDGNIVTQRTVRGETIVPSIYKAYIENYIINTEDFLEIDEDLLQEESKKKIYFALNKLKKEYKIVIYLKDIHGFKIKEISTILNKTVPHTKVLVHRARKALAKELGKEGYVC